jgi:hypothetical protein
MEPIKKNTVELNAIEDTKTATQAQTPADALKASVDQAEVKKSVSESPKAEKKSENTRKHSIIYLAGGIWKDAKGQFWCRDKKSNCISSAVFTEEEFAKRSDIQYMIEYGAMKDVIVE